MGFTLTSVTECLGSELHSKEVSLRGTHSRWCPPPGSRAYCTDGLAEMSRTACG